MLYKWKGGKGRRGEGRGRREGEGKEGMAPQRQLLDPPLRLGNLGIQSHSRHAVCSENHSVVVQCSLFSVHIRSLFVNLGYLY